LSNKEGAPKQLSARKLAMAVAAAGLLVTGTFIGNQWRTSSEPQRVVEPKPKAATSGTWFAGYVDVTAAPAYRFESVTAKAGRSVVLSGIVGAPDGPCVPTWGGRYRLPEAAARLQLDRRTAQLQAQDGRVAVAFGGPEKIP